MTLSIQALCKRYGHKQVLSALSLTAHAEDIIGIVGANGSGKSTMLSVLAGVQRATSGSFLLDECELFSNKKLLSASVGYVPQSTVLLEELSARDNLRLWYTKRDLHAALQDEKSVVSLLGVQAFLDVAVFRMSGGMKKRLAIACALAKNPRVLLLDEPTAALDLPCKQKLYQFYKAFSAGGGILLLVTHDASELALCTQSFILQQGALSPYNYDGDIERLSALLEESAALDSGAQAFACKKR